MDIARDTSLITSPPPLSNLYASVMNSFQYLVFNKATAPLSGGNQAVFNSLTHYTVSNISCTTFCSGELLLRSEL